MTYYSLPILHFNHNSINKLHLTHTSIENINIIMNKTLHTYISNAKKNIDDTQIEWDKFKKYVNPYEYIHTVVPNASLSVCKLKPISRSFYKMIEICTTLHLFAILPFEKCKTFHFAEGPGGFIEAMCYYRENTKDTYCGMTLVKELDTTIPGWKKSKHFLEQHKNVMIWNGVTQDGDLLKPENLKQCYLQHNNSCDLVTGDGGFDFSLNYEHQEVICLKLIFAQCAYAMACQKKGGNFIIKMFDMFTHASLDLLYILSNVYEHVYIFKPHTSRQANSEKYVICKNFYLDDSKDLVMKMYNIIKSFEENKYPERFLSIDIPYNYFCALQEINAILGQSQLECIYSTLNLVNYDNERIENLKKIHICKCIHWCQKFKMPYNKINC